MRPFQTPHKIIKSQSVNLDAWYGARNFATSNNLPTFLTTKQDYDEKGGEYFRDHFSSNQYYATPAPTIIVPELND